MIRTFQGINPTIPASCFIEETGVVIGDVVFGEHCSVWFHAVVRGDVHLIRMAMTKKSGHKKAMAVSATAMSTARLPRSDPPFIARTHP